MTHLAGVRDSRENHKHRTRAPGSAPHVPGQFTGIPVHGCGPAGQASHIKSHSGIFTRVHHTRLGGAWAIPGVSGALEHG